MKLTLRNSFLAAAAVAAIGSVGPGATPAKADPNIGNIVGRIIDHALDRNDWRRGYNRRSRHSHDRYYDDDWDEHRRRHLQHNPYRMETRGLYRPGYDIRGVLDNNYSGHRH
ncbi:hypothetical protein [Roseovarius indicus]|uniref:Uncharacterized protein n=1 Tax=Roseovarius indicus TaxID=540747 RepID=A0A0T5PFX4_9RHOB|nr:hypothetical protein [Roseovarius indicus]KRS19838.1 hypothetical protein XM52_03165 [Roseovarius indicus]QEW28793.1 hypothetical protein RIdsm_04633 [Roseovarius indicus]SFD84261.1 hypothetical protein SAMN04488031_102869 [Roseovarius indicus]